MLIVSDGDDVRDLVGTDERIRLIHIDSHPAIGDKRNFGCEHAHGDLIAIFDDDDWSASGRLADQVGRIGENAVTGYHSMRFTDGAKWWKYQGAPGYSIGTSLMFRRDWWKVNPFPSLQVGEDNHMVSAARAQGQLIAVDAGEMQYATIHESNTSPRNMGGNWKEITC